MRRLAAFAVLLAAGYLLWYHDTRFPVRSLTDPPQALEVPPGASAELIAERLHELGLVRHPLLFRALVAWRGAGGRLRAGDYTLDGPLSLEQVLDKLVHGDTERNSVTFPEGRSLEDMAALLAPFGEAQSFLKAARDPAPIRDLDPEAKDLEGYLFPDTYELPRRPGAGAALVARMLARFREVIGPELPRLTQRGLKLRQLVTLASIIELETGRPEERPRIAAVFLNRLAEGMPLQTDPTVIYALRRAGRWDGNIRKKDLEIDDPYNTYKHRGLPPGPIAAPGREALLAVLDPALVKDRYFVSRNDGTHEFSETLVQHERAVDRYQRRRRPG